MKKIRRDREQWKPSDPILPVAIFYCRRCQSILTNPLKLLLDEKAINQKVEQPLVPSGHYWLVPGGSDFADQLAIAIADLINGSHHPDERRLIGCCGPCGAHGMNRICSCGYEIGTERSDCIWPHAIYLEPSRVLAMAPMVD